tara:strand:- start:289 stop:777 length:489 start_codon:yes stop_codon:yes gene_type:complete
MAQAAQVIAMLACALGQFVQSERLAAAGSAIIPGMLLEEVLGKVQEHSTAGGNAQTLFALSDLTVGGSIDTAYAVGTTVRYGAAHSGQEVFALVAASATAIADGAPLQSAGNGTLAVWVGQAVNEGGAATLAIETNNIVAYAMEAIDNSGGATSVRIKARAA